MRADTFHNIGKNWGKVITLDDATSKGSSFSILGKVKILTTNVFEAINQVFALDFNGYSYPVRVIEEQAVMSLINFLKATISCRGCGV